jgi:hypothetical protein
VRFSVNGRHGPHIASMGHHTWNVPSVWFHARPAPGPPRYFGPPSIGPRVVEFLGRSGIFGAIPTLPVWRNFWGMAEFLAKGKRLENLVGLENKYAIFS